MLTPKKRYNKSTCFDIIKNNAIDSMDGNESLIKDTFEDNEGFSYVYINFDLENKYKAIIYEGNFKDTQCPYKRIHCYPYEKEIFKIGQYISYYDAYNHRIDAIIDALDTHNKEGLIGHIYKCNNMLRWYDTNKVLHEYPCVYFTSTKNNSFDYNQSIDVVDGISKVKVQYNEHTKHIRENDKFVFNGITMVVTEINNHFQSDIFEQDSVGIITFDMKKVTKSTNDDIENNIADVNKYEYVLNINEEISELNILSTGKLTYTLLLNKSICNKKCVFESYDSNIIEITEDGDYTCVNTGTVRIACFMQDNKDIKDELEIEVINTGANDVVITVIPTSTKILQGKTNTYTCKKIINGIDTNEILNISTMDNVPKDYYELIINGNEFSIHNIKQYKYGKLTISISDNSGNIGIFDYTLGATFSC